MVTIATTNATAQEPDSTVFRIGEIVVQATRPVTTTGGASAIEVRFDSIRLAAPSLEQLMRVLPLVQVRTNSRGEAQFSLRGSGSDARQVAVLVDGVPLSLGWDDRADLSVIPITAAQTITLSRGLPSLLYGPNVLGGVVEIGVARGAAATLNPQAVRVEAGADHAGGHALSAALTLPLQFSGGQLLLRAGGGHRGRDGVPLPDDIAEPVAGADPDLRLNTDLRQNDAFAAVRYQSKRGGWAALTTAGFTAERGIPAELHISGARFWRYPEIRRGLAVLSGGTGERASPFGGAGDIELSVGLDAARTEIDQYSARDYQQIIAEENGDDRNITVRVRADQTVGTRAELRAGFTYADISHDERLTPGGSAPYRQRLWSGAAEVSLRPYRTGALRGTRISAGVAYDGADTPESGDKPPLAALHDWGARAGFTTLTAAGRVLVHAGLSRRARFPALRELYSGALGRFEPNPGLAPEKLLAAEAGTTLRIGRGELQLVGFHHTLADAIVRISRSDGKFMRVNRDRQRTIGLELLASAALEPLALGAELTMQDTKLTDDAGVESEPEYQPDVIAGLFAVVRLPFGARLDVRGRHIGRQVCVNPERNTLDAVASARRLDIEASAARHLRRRWVSTIELSGALDNTTGATIFDQCGLPQPVRTLRFLIRLR